MILQELTVECGDKAVNRIGALQYAPIASILQPYMPIIRETDGAIIYQPSFPVGSRWLILPFLAAVEKVATDGISDNKFGVTHKQVITTTLPKLTSKGFFELQKMKILRDFVVRYQDKNGYWWLLGDSEFPCFFDYDVETSGRVKVTWTANNIRPILSF